ncbi:MAG TPA: thiamine pyrophosphate-dependent enzyme [Humisphaera sp.]
MSQDRLQHLAETLAAAGTRHAFGVTGSGQSLSLIAALEARGVAYHPASHEAAAAMMAGAVTAATGAPAVSISIKGPGLSNMLPGIAANAFENRPALSISEAFGPGVPSYRKHKRLDHGGLLAPVVKGSLTLDRAADLPALLALAAAEVPGPVHLDLSDGGAAVAAGPADAARAADRSAIDGAIAAIRAAARPVIIAGSLAARRGYGPLLTVPGVPVFTTAAGKGAVDESLPQAAGVFTGDGKSLTAEATLIAEADLVVGVGLRNTELLSPKPFGRRTILLDEVDGGLSEGLGGELVVARAEDVQEVLRELHLVGREWGSDRIRAIDAALRTRLLSAGAWSAPAAVDLLNRPTAWWAANAFTLVADTGSFCTVAEHLWRAGPARSYLGSSNGRYMGTGLPTAVGAACASAARSASGTSSPPRPLGALADARVTPRGAPVVCLVGDGGIRMHVAELRLAVAERLPLCVVLMSDGRFGSVACAAGPLAGHRAVGVDGASWWRAAEAMGCDAVQVESMTAFGRALDTWRADGPLFIEAVFEPEAYAAMTKDVR